MTQRFGRSLAILIIFFFGLMACAIRLVDLQIIKAPMLATEGEAVRTSQTGIAAKRGSITDATGTILADSILTYDIAVNQINLRSYVHSETTKENGVEKTKVVGRGPVEAARQLAPLLHMSEAEL